MWYHWSHFLLNVWNEGRTLTKRFVCVVVGIELGGVWTKRCGRKRLHDCVFGKPSMSSPDGKNLVGFTANTANAGSSQQQPLIGTGINPGMYPGFPMYPPQFLPMMSYHFLGIYGQHTGKAGSLYIADRVDSGYKIPCAPGPCACRLRSGSLNHLSPWLISG